MDIIWFIYGFPKVVSSGMSALDTSLPWDEMTVLQGLELDTNGTIDNDT